MEEGRFVVSRAQQHKAIIIDWHIPKIGMCKACHVRKITEEPAREINEVYTLIDEFATTRQSRVGAPLFVIPDSPTMTVATPDKHHIAHRTRLIHGTRLQQ